MSTFNFRISIGKARVPISRTAFRGPQQIFEICKELGELNQETFCCICLNNHNHVISKNIITVGLVNQSPVHPREVFRIAISEGASGVVLAHNHPSGDPTPSIDDLRVTRQLIEASRIIGIPILDHVIIGMPTETNLGFLSLREKGLCCFDSNSGNLMAADSHALYG